MTTDDDEEEESLSDDIATPDTSEYVRRHLLFAWWSLALFLILGLLLDAMHGLKVGYYLDVQNSTRRLMWTLSHAHGSLLALVHVAFAYTLRAFTFADLGWLSLASPGLIASSVLLPGGFFLGGLFIYGGDPGLGVLLTPVGGVVLVGAAIVTARAVQQGRAA